MTAPAARDVPRWLQIGTVALLAVATVVGWVPGLSWGLWLDETFTAWQVDQGVAAIVPHKLGDPAQSVLFAYLEALFYFPGSPHMEAWLRLPAVLGAIACCVLAYRLAESLVGKGTGMLAAIALAGSPAMIVYSSQARPYTWAVAACLATVLSLHRWLEAPDWGHGLAAAVSMALVIHLHLLFGAFGLVPAFMVWRRARRGEAIAWKQLLAMVAVVVLLLLPLVPLLRMLSRVPDPSALPPPRLPELLDAWLPGIVLLALVAFGCLLLAVRRPAIDALRKPLPGRPLALALFWLLAPALLLFVASRLLHKTVLIDRYVLHVIGAQALIVAILFRGFHPVLARVGLFAVFGTILLQHGFQSWSQRDSFSSWRQPLAEVRLVDPSASAPVFVQSGHPPSNAMDWQHGIEQHTFFYSQLAAYPLSNPVYPLPYTLDDNMRAYVRRIAEGPLANAPLILLAGLPNHPTIEWVRQYFEARGYASTYAVRQGLCLLVFRKPAPAAHGG